MPSVNSLMMKQTQRFSRQIFLISRIFFVALTAVSIVFLPSAHAQKSEPQTVAGVLCQVKTAKQAGPTVLIFGASKAAPVAKAGTSAAPASEPAKTVDARAMEQIADWPLLKGKLVFVAQADAPTGTEKATTFLQAVRPDWVLDLRDDARAVEAVQTVSVPKSSAANAPADLLKQADEVGGSEAAPLALLNGAPDELFDPLALAAYEKQRVPVVCAVSAGKAAHPALSVRTRFLRIAASRLLQGLQMVDKTSENALLPAGLPKTTVRVAMYDSDGASGAGPANLETQISAQPDMVFRRVCAGDIRGGVLRDFDVVIHPGGSGTGQGKNLGPTGIAREKAFITRGGGYIGICGGDYLASTSYPWSLGCVDADVMDRPHWLRGKANLQVELTPKGKEIFGDVLGDTSGLATVLYHNGPVLSPTKTRKDSNYEPLLVFKNEIAAEKGVKNIMVGSAAIAADQMGQGRVLGISPHPEQTPGMEAVVPRAVRWVARRPLTSPAKK